MKKRRWLPEPMFVEVLGLVLFMLGVMMLLAVFAC